MLKVCWLLVVGIFDLLRGFIYFFCFLVLWVLFSIGGDCSRGFCCLFFFFLIFLNLFFNHPTFLISKSLYCRKQFFVTLYPVEELMVIKTLTLGLFSMTLTSFEMQNLFRLSNPYTQYSSILSFSPILFSPLLLS